MSAPARRVLVIDDATEFLSFMELLLGGEGYSVQTATSLTAAAQALAEGPPDIIVADAMLPGQPAFGLLDWLDADPATRAIPVLLCTAAEPELRAHPERVHAPRRAALLKPFDIDQVLECLAWLLA